MKTIAGFTFPDTSEEAKLWKPIIAVRPLARRVLAAANTRIEGHWAAYCDAVDGHNHEAEFDHVLRQGVKLPQDIANVIFPQFADLPYSR